MRAYHTSTGHRVGRCLPHIPAEDGTGFLSLTRSALAELEALGCSPVDCPVALGSFVVPSLLKLKLCLCLAIHLTVI